MSVISVGILIDQVVDRERNDLGIGIAAGISRLDGDVMALIGLEVDGCAGRDPDLVTDDLEEARGIIGDRIGVAVAGIGVDRAQRGNRCSGSSVLVNEPPVSVISVGFSSIRSLTVSVMTSE